MTTGASGAQYPQGLHCD